MRKRLKHFFYPEPHLPPDGESVAKRRPHWRHVPRFHPHDFSPGITLADGIPQIRVSFEAYKKMWLYVCASGDDEISWLGTVRQEENEFFIDDVWLVEQRVTSVESEITPAGLHALAKDLLAQKNGEENWNRMRFWGHYHPFNNAEPSSQDETQLREFLESGHEFFIRGICCRGGQIQFTVYLIQKGLIITDAPWSLDMDLGDEDLRRAVAEEVEQKVRKRAEPRTVTVGGQQYEEWINHGQRAARHYQGTALDKVISRHQTTTEEEEEAAWAKTNQPTESGDDENSENSE